MGKVKEQVDVKQVTEEVTFNPNQYVTGDPVVAYIGEPKSREVGKVVNVESKDKNIKVTVDFKNIDKPHIFNDKSIKNLEPLFFAKTKKHTMFSEKEIDFLFEKKAFKGLTIFDLTKSNDPFKARSTKNALRMGNWTAVISHDVSHEKDGATNIFNAAQRFKVILNNNKVNVWNSMNKAEKLVIPEVLKTPYGEVELSKSQQEQLKTTGNLGLVKDVVNKETGNVLDLYIAVDAGLKRVVSRPANTVFMDKVYGKKITAAQKKILDSGKGITVNLKNTEGQKFSRYIEINPSSTNSTGVRNVSSDQAKSYGWDKSEDVKKKSNKTGVKM